MSAKFRASRLSAAAGVMAAALGLALFHEPAAAGSDGGPGRFGGMRHDGPGDANHPVYVVPSSDIRVPSAWPVDFNGAITCLTCHASLPSWDGAGGPKLRDTDSSGGLAFCAKCHADDSSRNQGNMHWTVTGVAHLRYDDAGRRSAGLLDGDSQRCLGCHDGVSARDFGFIAGDGMGRKSAVDLRHTHPVGIAYKATGRGGRNARLRPAMLLPPEVRLPSGRVSCVSCHNLYARDQSRLAAPIENSHLCFTCHDMD